MKIKSVQRLFSFGIAIAAIVLLANKADADLIASIGTSSLTNNSANQTIQVFLTSGIQIDDIEGINVFASIGTGLPGQTATPKFTSFLFNPVITSAFASPFFAGSTPEAGGDFTANPQVIDFGTPGVGFDLSTTPTLLGTFTIDTTGVFDQSFSFFIGNSGGGGATSDVNVGGNSTPFIAGTNGFVSFDVGTVSAVPEPSSVILCAIASAGLVAVRFRRKKVGNIPSAY